MDNTGQENTKSRSEIIKLARESCSKNLNPSASRIHTYKSSPKGEYSSPSLKPIKLMWTRILFAIGILVTVITINSLDKRYETNYGSKIEEWVTSSMNWEKAEDFFVSLIEKIDKTK